MQQGTNQRHGAGNETASPLLKRDALSILDLLIAGMSYMAPGFSLFFTTAVIAGAAGIHIPLMYLFAGAGVLCTGAALAEFSRLAPSAGSLQTFIARGFGPTASVAGGLILVVGYVCLQAGVSVLFGGWTASLLSDLFGIAAPWPLLMIIGVVVCTAMMVLGVHLSIRTTWALFLIEFTLVVIISIAVIVQGGAHGLTAQPFSLSALSQIPLGGIALGMVFATFSFVGFEGSISFAEETPDPRRALPIAVMGGLAAMIALYVLATYAAVIGFGVDKIGDLAGDPEPIATVTKSYAHLLLGLLKFSVWTSIVANLMAAGNANARILFNLGREGALPAAIGRIHPRFKTPHVAIMLFMALTLVPGLLAASWWDYLTAFGNIAGFGALLALLIYMVATAALPAFLRRRAKPGEHRLMAHLVIPVVGVAIWLIPLWGSLAPGQAFPFNLFPWLALGVVALAIVYALAVVRRVDVARSLMAGGE
jgi:amino acid transporter